MLKVKMDYKKKHLLLHIAPSTPHARAPNMNLLCTKFTPVRAPCPPAGAPCPPARAPCPPARAPCPPARAPSTPVRTPTTHVRAQNMNLFVFSGPDQSSTSSQIVKISRPMARYNCPSGLDLETDEPNFKLMIVLSAQLGIWSHELKLEHLSDAARRFRCKFILLFIELHNI